MTTNNLTDYQRGAERGMQAGFILGAFVMSMLLALIWPDKAHAETMAQHVFGQWQPVTVAEINKEVPEIEYQRIAYGSAQPKETNSPLPAACALWEGGKVIGYSLTCKGASRR